jgi:hypothetical protein
MPNSHAHTHGTEKNKGITPHVNAGQKDHGGSPKKKESLKPEMKREYELLEQYVLNFSGSSF